jgi:hypothetical protein
MKTRNLVLLAIILIAGQSCTIFSLNPLYHEEDLLEMPEVLGLWEDADEEKTFVSFERLDDNKFIFRYMEANKQTVVDLFSGKEETEVIAENMESLKEQTVSFEAGILKVGDHYFIDLYPYYKYYEDDDRDEEYYLFRNFVPTHSFLKFEWENGQLVLYMFSYDRLQELFEQNRIRIRHQQFDDYIVITASTDELQKFIRKYADDEKAFEDPEKYVKIR